GGGSRSRLSIKLLIIDYVVRRRSSTALPWSRASCPRSYGQNSKKGKPEHLSPNFYSPELSLTRRVCLSTFFRRRTGEGVQLTAYVLRPGHSRLGGLP